MTRPQFLAADIDFIADTLEERSWTVTFRHWCKDGQWIRVVEQICLEEAGADVEGDDGAQNGGDKAKGDADAKDDGDKAL
jgi:hypothetical protein